MCFPLCRPRVPGAHVCHVFVATSFKATVHSDRLRRCKPPPYRIGFFSKPPCFRVRLAQLIFQHAQHSRPPRYTTQQMSNRRDRGPWPQSSALCAERAFNVGMRWDGGGLHRLAGPGREQLSAPCRAILANEPSNTLHDREQGRRLDAVPSACW